MTDFHKLFMVKLNKKKTGVIFLVVYIIYDSFVYTDSKKTVSCLRLLFRQRLHTIYATLEHN